MRSSMAHVTRPKSQNRTANNVILVAPSRQPANDGGMNTHFEHDRQLAAKLKSLSLEPAAIIEPPTRRRGKMLLGVGMITALSVAVVGGTTVFTGTWEGLKGTLTSQPAVNVPQASAKSEAVVHTTAPAQVAKIIAGSGHVVAPVSAALFSKQTARVALLHADVGDHVVAGQALIGLEDADTRLSVDTAANATAVAETALARAKFELEQSEITAERALALWAKQAMAKSALEDALAARERARFGVATAHQALQAARVTETKARSALGDLTVTAPISGVVIERQAQRGQMALSLMDAGDATSSLMTIADLSQLVIDIDIAESSLASVKPGMTGEAILDAYPDKPFPVTVIRLAPAASVERGTVGIRLSTRSPPDGIRPNLAARVSLSSSALPSQETTEKGNQP